MNSYEIYKKAMRLVKEAGSRDPYVILSVLNILVYYNHFDSLYGFYTYMQKRRVIILNDDMPERIAKLVLCHEIGHDQLHRDIAKKLQLYEATLFDTKSSTEYEANAFAAHILIDDEDILNYLKEGHTTGEYAQNVGLDENLVLIKIQELKKLKKCDSDFECRIDKKFLRNI